MFFKTLMTAATIVALVAAGPCSPPTDCPDICIDGINDCGVMWGGCYNICSPESSPTPPPCKPTDCPEVCMDGINDCGVKYGGCYLSPGATMFALLSCSRHHHHAHLRGPPITLDPDQTDNLD
ncbi:hypothetical protein F53441_3903 [Fusarium austroafricanum]|uniref:Kazal-like domain-containing protein n=1 Tax=Fusarium austroafricanum TaxID=2364996 RepID=A0A8H4KPY2_9HYPO|nr:hypothetical protein F53441_3903 [Fusarium austroafricanum]